MPRTGYFGEKFVYTKKQLVSMLAFEIRRNDAAQMIVATDNHVIADFTAFWQLTPTAS
jgi:hypothetical protein